MNKQIQDSKKRDKESANHHKEVHRKSHTKFCPDCGVQIQFRCPYFMQYGYDCGDYICKYCAGVYYC